MLLPPSVHLKQCLLECAVGHQLLVLLHHQQPGNVEASPISQMFPTHGWLIMNVRNTLFKTCGNAPPALCYVKNESFSTYIQACMQGKQYKVETGLTWYSLTAVQASSIESCVCCWMSSFKR